MGLRLVMAALLVLLPSIPSWAQSRFVAELRSFSTRYHEDPSRLDAIRDGLERAVTINPHVEDLVALAQVYFIWGDVRATSEEKKLAAYDRGRQVANQARNLDPSNPEAHFWYGANTARWGQTKGVVRSLFLLPAVQETIQLILDLDPNFIPVYALAGNVFYEVPGLLGGDLVKAEAMFRKGLELDPNFTVMRVGLARTLIKKGQITEARRELEAVLNEKEPRNLADWTLKDSKEARILLESIQRRFNVTEDLVDHRRVNLTTSG
ncbi:MAG TPA: tetratricopeptide repeat protein [Candidatus Methylomirabilis sp.]|nr:tetratricopeptide repeat protein [Candidatus Methylomirabilis sp.]